MIHQQITSSTLLILPYHTLSASYHQLCQLLSEWNHSWQLKIIGFFATMTQFTSISTAKYEANLIWDSGGEWTGAGKNFVQN